MFFGMVFGSGFNGCPQAENSPQSGNGLAGNLVYRSRGNRSNPPGKSGHSVLWFLAQWVELLQGIGSGHSALGANTKQRVTGP